MKARIVGGVITVGIVFAMLYLFSKGKLPGIKAAGSTAAAA
jgi:hypothetical protein